jgi:menaquinone-dependent protoporphyrinogen oxidase
MNERPAGQLTNTILVAYATRYGSTREVAEAIASTLRERHHSVDVVLARDVGDLDRYHTVVLGAPFYMGGWHKDARRFLTQHHDALIQRPVAIFALGPVRPEDDISEAAEQLDRELEHHPWLSPIAVEMFGGKYDPSRLTFAHKLLSIIPASPLHGLRASDLRDWDAIHGWADDVATRLPGEESEAPEH